MAVFHASSKADGTLILQIAFISVNAFVFDKVGTDVCVEKSHSMREGQERNALLPILVTLLGIVILVREEQ